MPTEHIAVWPALSNPDVGAEDYERVYAVMPQAVERAEKDEYGDPNFPYPGLGRPGEGELFFVGLYAQSDEDKQEQVNAITVALGIGATDGE
jgi:hypothetical protein